MKRRNLFISFIITIFFVTGCSPVGFDYSDGYTDGILTEEGWEFISVMVNSCLLTDSASVAGRSLGMMTVLVL